MPERSAAPLCLPRFDWHVRGQMILLNGYGKDLPIKKLHCVEWKAKRTVRGLTGLGKTRKIPGVGLGELEHKTKTYGEEK